MTRGRIAGLAVLAVFAVLGLVPIANWIPDELAAPWYAGALAQWLSGSAIAVGVGVIVALVARRAPGLWRSGAGRDAFTAIDPANLQALGFVAVAAFGIYLAVAVLVFSAKPLHVDEMVQLMQARMYAAGRLWQPTDPDPTFQSILHQVDFQGRTFGHFPPGGPLVLALGDLWGVPWIMVPLTGAIAVVAWGLILRRIEPAPSVRGAALVLFAGAPFTAFLAGSEMNHMPALMWLLLALAAALYQSPDRLRPGLAFAAGLALGMAAATRPPDALAFGLAIAVWGLIRFRRSPGLSQALGAALLGAAIPVAGILLVNQATTGAPLRFGYELLWGKNVGLGFHAAPWGPPHTPLRGLELVNLYLLRLEAYLFETPFPALLPALAALGLSRRMDSGDRLLLGASAALLGLYFMYWHDGFYLGPRFAYGLIPAAVLWSARFPGLVRERWGDGLVHRATVTALVVGALLAAVRGIPDRVAQYASSFPAFRWDPDRAPDFAGVRNAVVFVQETWGSAVLARLWSLGVPKAKVERLYRAVDT
ncbi:MAG: hypothetical protein ABI647_07085, partial [Gemmatimonadota bacterium]